MTNMLSQKLLLMPLATCFVSYMTRTRNINPVSLYSEPIKFWPSL